jgi:chromosome segregation ATPase
VTDPQKDEEAVEADPEGDSGEEIEDLEPKLRTLQQGLEAAWDAIDDLEEDLEAEREERRRLEQKNEDLREEIEELHSRTDLLRLVESSDKMDAKQRRVALIQHLQKAAERERDRGRKAMASVNWEGALSALQYPDIDRTTVYTDLREAPGLVGNENVLWYESGSGGNSRLKLNLERGELPAGLLGKHVSNEVE